MRKAKTSTSTFPTPNILYSLLSIFFLSIVLYAHTLNYPFHFDDATTILHSKIIQDLPTAIKSFRFYNPRYLVNVSFALNYHFNQQEVFNYHLVNLAVHIATSFAVFGFTSALLNTPALRKKFSKKTKRWFSLITALIFVSHPIQTQAVTYISQRYTSMAALFYITTLFLYLQARLAKTKQGKITFFTLAFLWIFTSIYTKEIAFTIPFMILALEFYFFLSGNLRSIKFKWRTSYLLILPPMYFFFWLARVGAGYLLTHGTMVTGRTISTIDYLLTEFRVIVKYIQLLFVPINQNLDYYFPLSQSLTSPPTTLLSLLLLIGIGISAILLFKKHRLASFGITWFFITILPESSILPIEDVIFEHRLYLPLLGFILFLVPSLFRLLKNYSPNLIITSIMLITIYSFLTINRNLVWKSEFALWSDSVKKSPQKARPHFKLGLEYQRQGKLTKAINLYETAINLDDTSYDYAALYGNYGIIQGRLGNLNEAQIYLNKAKNLRPDQEDFNTAIENILKQIDQLQ